MLLLALLAVVSSGCGRQETGPAPAPNQESSQPQAAYEDVNAEQAKALMEQTTDLVILDVREPFEYEDGHLKGATLMPMGELEQRLNELDKNRAILVVCATGARSSAVASFLAENGFSKVKNLSGGLAAWPGELER